MQPSVSQILEFLQMLKNSNIGYSVINSARSSLSSLLTVEGYEAGKHPLACKYLKGIFNTNPSLPKYTFTCDVGKVINFLGKKWSENLKELSERTVTLLAILCGQRAREIITAMDTRNITFEENYVIIRIGDILKTTNQKNHTGEVKYPKFPSNTNICPVYCLTKYLDATKPFRTIGNTSLFVTTKKPYNPILKGHCSPMD